MIWPFPTKQTTPGQLLAFIAVVAGLLLLVGGYLLYLSLGQPPEKLELAMQARTLGIKLIVAACVTGTLAWLGQRFIA